MFDQVKSLVYGSDLYSFGDRVRERSSLYVEQEEKRKQGVGTIFFKGLKTCVKRVSQTVIGFVPGVSTVAYGILGLAHFAAAGWNRTPTRGGKN